MDQEVSIFERELGFFEKSEDSREKLAQYIEKFKISKLILSEGS
jgi:hypothetical protein